MGEAMTPSPSPSPTPPATTVEAPEREIAFDMVKRALPVAPLLVVIGGVGWGVNGALSVGYGVAIVLVNLLISAVILGAAAKRRPELLIVGALGGFAVRMLLVVGALAFARNQSWCEFVPLGITVLLTHVGLLFWESRHVSASLAYPGLKPRRTGA